MTNIVIDLPESDKRSLLGQFSILSKERKKLIVASSSIEIFILGRMDDLNDRFMICYETIESDKTTPVLAAIKNIEQWPSAYPRIFNPMGERELCHSDARWIVEYIRYSTQNYERPWGVYNLSNLGIGDQLLKDYTLPLTSEVQGWSSI